MIKKIPQAKFIRIFIKKYSISFLLISGLVIMSLLVILAGSLRKSGLQTLDLTNKLMLTKAKLNNLENQNQYQ